MNSIQRFTFEELLLKDGSISIHHCNLHVLAIEMFKVVSGLAPSLTSDSFTLNPNLNTGNVSATKYGLQTLRSLDPKIWDIVLSDTIVIYLVILYYASLTIFKR